MTDEEIEKEYNQLIVFGFIRNVETSDYKHNQLNVPNDLRNVIWEYYWISNDIVNGHLQVMLIMTFHGTQSCKD